jgi:transposase
MAKSDFTLRKKEAEELEKKRAEAKSNKDHDLDKRLRALLLVGKDRRTRIETASICEVSERSIYGWQKQYRDIGIEGLQSKQIPGRPKRLDEHSLEKLSKLVLMGPEASGYETGIWTVPLVTAMIRREFKVEYSVSQVRRILHELGFSVQYPKKNSREQITDCRRNG